MTNKDETAKLEGVGSTGGLGWTRNRERVLWDIYTGQLSTLSSSTAIMLEKRGLTRFSKNFRPGSWILTDTGRKLLFKWKPELSNPNKSELTG